MTQTDMFMGLRTACVSVSSSLLRTLSTGSVWLFCRIWQLRSVQAAASWVTLSEVSNGEEFPGINRQQASFRRSSHTGRLVPAAQKLNVSD